MKRLAIVLAILAAHPALASAAREHLQREHPYMRWHHVLDADLDGDGKRDAVFSARSDGRFHVAVVLASTLAVSTVSFAFSGNSQDAFCGPPQSIEKERLDDDVEEMLGEKPAGFRASRRYAGLVIDTGDCDKFHLYWNHDDHVLAWWRL